MTNSGLRFNRRKLFVIIHPAFLVLLTIFLQNISVIRFDEKYYFKYFFFIKNMFNSRNIQAVKNDVVFLNVAKDLQLADDGSVNGYSGNKQIKGAQIVLTDRKKLTLLFAELSNHLSDHKMVFCDLLFEDSTSNDSALAVEIAKMPNLTLASAVENGKLKSSVFKGVHGGVTFRENDGAFIKLPVFYSDSCASLPALLLQKTSTNRFKRAYGMTWENERLAFNTILPELFFQSADLSAGHPQVLMLGDILTEKDFYKNHLLGKNIVIGDFSGDLHDTYFGKLPGCFILWDCYLTLNNHSLQIPWKWLVFLYAYYCLLSYYILYPLPKWLEKTKEKVKIRLLFRFIDSYLSYLGLAILMSLISYLFFNLLISVFLIAGYLTLIATIIEKNRLYRRHHSLKQLITDEFL